MDKVVLGPAISGLLGRSIQGLLRSGEITKMDVSPKLWLCITKSGLNEKLLGIRSSASIPLVPLLQAVHFIYVPVLMHGFGQLVLP
jgi:hypothetical protein